MLIKFYVHKSAQKTEKHAFVLPHKLNICIQEGTAYSYIFETWTRFIKTQVYPELQIVLKRFVQKGAALGFQSILPWQGFKGFGARLSKQIYCGFSQTAVRKKTERRRKRMKQMARESSLTAFSVSERETFGSYYEKKSHSWLHWLSLCFLIMLGQCVLKFKPLRNLNGWSCTVQMHLELLFSAVDFM